MTYDPEDLSAQTIEEALEREQQRRDRDAGEYTADGKLSTRERRIDERERICAARIAEGGGFCVMFHKHQGPCAGIREQYGPMLPPPDRRLMSSFRSELSEKYDTKERRAPWVDRFGEKVSVTMSPARWWELRAQR